MCFGVRDAIALAVEEADTGPLTILGDLVHNPTVLSTLESKGIAVAHDVAHVTTPTLMVTAHGTSERTLAQTRALGLTAIEATCHDYVDGQLEADPQRVARSLHPDLAKRAVLGDTPDERLGLRRMSKEELVSLTKQGALKTPKDQWDRRCTVLDVTGNAASVRLETPWFVDYFHMGRFDQRWVIVNALWYPKPKAH